MDVINLNRFIKLMYQVTTIKNMLVVCSTPGKGGDIDKIDLVIDWISKYRQIQAPISITAINQTDYIPSEQILDKWKKAHNVNIDKIIRGGFPSDVPENVRYDVVWFAGCNIMTWVFPNRECVYTLYNILNKGGIVCFTEGKKYAEANKVLFQYPFISYDNYHFAPIDNKEYYAILDVLDITLTKVDNLPFYTLNLRPIDKE